MHPLRGLTVLFDPLLERHAFRHLLAVEQHGWLPHRLGRQSPIDAEVVIQE
jgi:hypothetical protein